MMRSLLGSSLVLLVGCGARSGLDAAEREVGSDAAVDVDAGARPDAGEQDAGRSDAGGPVANARPEICPARPPDSLMLDVRGERWPSVYAVAGLTEACGAVQLVLASSLEREGGSPFDRPAFPYLTLTFPGAADSAPGRYPVTGALVDRFDRVELEGTFELTHMGVPHDDPRGSTSDEDQWCACDPDHVPAELPDATCDGRPASSSVSGHLRIDHPEVPIDVFVDARHCHLLHAICF